MPEIPVSEDVYGRIQPAELEPSQLAHALQIIMAEEIQGDGNSEGTLILSIEIPAYSQFALYSYQLIECLTSSFGYSLPINIQVNAVNAVTTVGPYIGVLSENPGFNNGYPLTVYLNPNDTPMYILFIVPDWQSANSTNNVFSLQIAYTIEAP